MTYYKKGSWNVICDICGCKRKREEVRKTWDGFMACNSNCWYPKHPNDNPRKIINDNYPVPNARPRPAAQDWYYIPFPGDNLSTWENLNWDDTTSYWTWDGDLSTVSTLRIP